jgi:acetyl esterase/lipase
MIGPRPTDLLGEIYAEWAVEMARQPSMSLPLLRILFDDWQRATAEPEGVRYKQSAVGGVPGIWALPDGADESRALLVLHGGGFALGSAISHRKLAGHLARRCGATAFVADFRRAPEHPYPAPLDDALAVFDGLLAAGHDAADITPVGDSAGGNLAIGLTLRLRDAGRDLPSQVVVLSPWLDMENSGATIETNDATDFLITREGLQGNIDRYLAGGADPQDPQVNPLYADFTGFPRLFISASDTESLYADALRLDQLARKAGIDVTFSVGEGMQHVFPLLAGNHPRADAELHAIAAWYRSGLPTS